MLIKLAHLIFILPTTTLNVGYPPSHSISGCFKSHVFLHQPNSPFSDDAVKLTELWSFLDFCWSPDEIVKSFATLAPPCSRQKTPFQKPCISSNIFGVSNFICFYRFQASPLGFFECPFFWSKVSATLSYFRYASDTPKPCGGNGKRSRVYWFTGLPFLGAKAELQLTLCWSWRHKRTNMNRKVLEDGGKLGKCLILLILYVPFLALFQEQKHKKPLMKCG